MIVPAKKKRGFTLIEVIITMTIFVLLSASVFGILTAVLQGTSTLEDNQSRRDQLVALRDFLKNQIGTLSPKSSLVSYRRGDGEGLPVNGIIWSEEHTARALDAKIQPNGLYTLRLARYEAVPSYAGQTGTVPSTTETSTAIPTLLAFSKEIQREDVSLAWIPLMRDVKMVDWKFQDNLATDWQPLWIDPNRRPTLIQFSISSSVDTQPTVMDFWLPNLTSVTLTAPLNGGDTNTPATNSPAAHGP